ncbi:MAG: dTDP-glucose 4,6-dehydratase [Anaerolineales bacterium]|nr:dTDP-glucose 4,6-dehydratase [Anaerolineales bacterium]
MKNVLVTGGVGFIGSNFINYLLEKESRVHVVNLDLLIYPGGVQNIASLNRQPRHTFAQGDICDSALVGELLKKYAVDTIVNFAAETHVDRSIVEPDQFIKTNVHGTFTLLEEARKYWALAGMRGRFHQISTDEVFGSLNPEEAACTERTPYHPRSPYSASKASADLLAQAYFHTYQMAITLSHCSNNYGPRQFPEKLIPLTIANLLQAQEIPIYGDGLQIRDWLYVEDHCEALYLILRDGQAGESYNIGGENQMTNLELVERICARFDQLRPALKPYRQLIKRVSDRPGHDRRYALAIAKVRQIFQWTPKHGLESGLDKTIQWYLDHLDWLDSILTDAAYLQWVKQNYEFRGQG